MTTDSSKEDKFANRVYDNFKISGTGEALSDFNDLPRVQLKNDDVQGLDTKWDEVLFSMTKIPDEDLFEKCTRGSSTSPLN